MEYTFTLKSDNTKEANDNKSDESKVPLDSIEPWALE
jgi:hypothetical protein